MYNPMKYEMIKQKVWKRNNHHWTQGFYSGLMWGILAGFLIFAFAITVLSSICV